MATTVETIDMSDCECCQESGSGGGSGCQGECVFMWTGEEWAPISNTCIGGQQGGLGIVCTCAPPINPLLSVPPEPVPVVGQMVTVGCFPS